MLTAYGRLVRKHRIDRGITLREMAQHLKVSAAFLSAMENGRKPIPESLLAKVANFLELDIDKRAELKKAAEMSKKDIKMRFDERASGKDRDLAATFARTFGGLNEEEKDQIRRILEGRSA